MRDAHEDFHEEHPNTWHDHDRWRDERRSYDGYRPYGYNHYGDGW
jgi:hypothetical protein